jgi:hypothetical protein
MFSVACCTPASNEPGAGAELSGVPSTYWQVEKRILHVEAPVANRFGSPGVDLGQKGRCVPQMPIKRFFIDDLPENPKLTSTRPASSV